MDNYILKVLRKSKKGLTIDEITKKVKNYLENDGYDFNDDDILYIKNYLDELEENYDVFKFGDLYKHISRTSYHKGVYHPFDNGRGKIVENISYIDGEGNFNTNKYEYLVECDIGAIDGDMVIADILNQRGKNSGNKVIKIISSDIDLFNGYIERNNGIFYIKPIDNKLKYKFIPISKDYMDNNGLVEGSVITLKVNRDDSGYVPIILSKNGHIDDPDSMVRMEAYKYGMDDYFSEDSLKEVESISLKVNDIEKIGRSDLTNEEIFTIDGIHTKDMDDAVNVKLLDNGNYLLGVHIADVAHYVKKGSNLDIDAFRKGNSTYADNTVIPMLPHELSNGICSLNPGVDRLTISCFMEIDSEGNIVNHNIIKSVISSKMKMDYDSVNKILKDDIDVLGYDDYKNSLLLMKKLSLILRRKRILDGSIEFDVGDREILRDENDNMIGAYESLNDVAENLIEEFMIAANETVDKHLTMIGSPCIHRVHDVPNESKVNNLVVMLNALGYRYNKYSAKQLVEDNNLMQDLANYISENTNIREILSRNLIKSMSKAKYSPENIGHYALAKSNYCHFTSPIRRYSDLVVHRLLYFYEFGEGNKMSDDELYGISSHISTKERDAYMVEKNVFDKKCAIYMQDHVGEDYDGIITDISQNNMKVRISNGIDGVIKNKSLGQYQYFPEYYYLISEDNIYKIGDNINVKVLKNDDVLRDGASLEEKEKYKEIILNKPNKLDNKTTYFKINKENNKIKKLIK